MSAYGLNIEGPFLTTKLSLGLINFIVKISIKMCNIIVNNTLLYKIIHTGVRNDCNIHVRCMLWIVSESW